MVYTEKQKETKKILHGCFIFQKYSDRGKTSRTTKHFPQTQFGLMLFFFFPWINTNASAYIQFIKYMYISCFEWVHNDTQLPFWNVTLHIHSLIFSSDLKVVLLSSRQCIFFSLFFFLLKLADFTGRNYYSLLLKSKQWHSTVYS